MIELNGIELQKLRINLQKMQMQNWNLAQANSVMIAVSFFSISSKVSPFNTLQENFAIVLYNVSNLLIVQELNFGKEKVSSSYCNSN